MEIENKKVASFLSYNVYSFWDKGMNTLSVLLRLFRCSWPTKSLPGLDRTIGAIPTYSINFLFAHFTTFLSLVLLVSKITSWLPHYVVWLFDFLNCHWILIFGTWILASFLYFQVIEVKSSHFWALFQSYETSCSWN